MLPQGFTRRISSLFMVCAVVLAGCGGGGNADNEGKNIIRDTVVNSSANYELVWSDEFNEVAGRASAKTSSSIRWNIETGYGPNGDGWGNNEWQLYTDSADNLALVADSSDSANGFLSIKARCSGACASRDGSITSARINTKDKFEFKYGKVQARIKVPAGKSTWSAFWMLGADYPDTPWPQSGEIDVMEVHQRNSDIKTTHSAAHWYNSEWQQFTQHKTLGSPLSDDFHIYEMEWDKAWLIGRIDGVEYFRKTIDAATMDEFQKPFYMILNVAVAGTLGADVTAGDPIQTTPQEMLVDWVRVYQDPDAGGGNSGGGETDPNVPATAAPAPTLPASDVISIFSNTYSPIGDVDYNPQWGQSTVYSTLSIESNDTIKLTSLNYQGLDFSKNVQDLSAMTTLHMDFWTPDEVSTGAKFKVKLVDFGANGVYQGGDDSEHELVFDANSSPALTKGGWVNFEIPLTQFSDLAAKAHMAQLVFSGADGLSTVYLDNIYFSNQGGTGGGDAPTTAAPAPTLSASNVISIFSDAYTSIAEVNTNPSWGQSTVVSNESVLGNNMLKYASLNYQGTDFAANPQDLSAMKTLHLDVWTPVNLAAGAKFKVKLVNFGTDRVYQGGDDSEHELTFTVSTTPKLIAGNWSSFAIPLSSFTGMTNKTAVAQLVISGADGLNTIYLDNIYFSTQDSGGSATEPTNAPAAPTADASGVISLYSDAYTSVGSNTTPGWGEVVTDATYASNSVKRTTNFLPFQLSAPIDITSKTTLHVDVWLAQLPSAGAGLLIKMLDAANGPHEGNYTHPMSSLKAGQWNSIEIPLSSFTQAQGIWDATAKGRIDQVLVDIVDDATMFVDNVYFHSGSGGGNTATTLGVYSETHTTGSIAHAVLSSSEQGWGSNPVAFNASSSAVSAADGSASLEVDWQSPLSTTWGGVVLNFTAATDVSAYTKLKLSVNTSQISNFGDLHVKLEDSTGGASGHIAYLSNHTGNVVTSGDWKTYTIPLSAFATPDKTILKSIGLWNPEATTTLGVQNITGKVYFDNIYFEK
ncbi:MAG TPA: glycoside hydrolase family 16 protein [Candidatus Thiothrix moscowensis]|uniref:glycoside hydrolase family 16 protein n=1 Tax=unclassified Thiothrix TaxID=2636184 RepID=UPI0025DC639B|nr:MULTISPECIES: glycoside hydrolase family 16 protein [unclassified Thiothrix]HRJ53638.1 glycoside hydrolase family 16 protein [Candidatus Thiothrix moscowensis]HRJ93720.1 glycoside hydrolase family 16 protein [Candidatus Thiothrix moscowensis]